MALGTAVIVGVGPGLGAALVRAFANAGHPVAMLDIDQARLDTDAAELASTGKDSRGYVTDAAAPGSLRTALRSAMTELGAPDVLVHNVGAVRKDPPIGGDDQPGKPSHADAAASWTGYRSSTNTPPGQLPLHHGHLQAFVGQLAGAVLTRRPGPPPRPRCRHSR